MKLDRGDGSERCKVRYVSLRVSAWLGVDVDYARRSLYRRQSRQPAQYATRQVSLPPRSSETPCSRSASVASAAPPPRGKQVDDECCIISPSLRDLDSTAIRHDANNAAGAGDLGELCDARGEECRSAFGVPLRCGDWTEGCRRGVRGMSRLGRGCAVLLRGSCEAPARHLRGFCEAPVRHLRGSCEASSSLDPKLCSNIARASLRLSPRTSLLTPARLLECSPTLSDPSPPLLFSPSWLGRHTHPFMPSEQHSAVDTVHPFTSELEAFVEELHERIALVDRDRPHRRGDVGRLGAVDDLEEGCERDLLFRIVGSIGSYRGGCRSV